jgi:hypothetical protein
MTEDGVTIQQRLRWGCVMHPQRWCGDVHTDLGGSVNEAETDNVMGVAAIYIDFLESLLAEYNVALTALHHL